MPSMVVRQQKFQMSGVSGANISNNNNNNNSHNTCNNNQMRASGGNIILEKSQHLPCQTNIANGPQHSSAPAPSSMKAANDLHELIELQQHQQQQQQQPQPQQQLFDQDGLVIPKRVLRHPVSVAQPIIRDLNRELKFNQVRGKNVLDQKSELKKALEKLEETKRRKEAEQERLSRRTSLELRLEERAERIAKEAGSTSSGSSSSLNPQMAPASSSGKAKPQANVCKQANEFTLKSSSR